MKTENQNNFLIQIQIPSSNKKKSLSTGNNEQNEIPTQISFKYPKRYSKKQLKKSEISRRNSLLTIK